MKNNGTLKVATPSDRDIVLTRTVTVLFPSREVRDTVVKSGLNRGAAESYDKLAACLAAARG